LSSTHRAGKSKAAFFGASGFSAGDWAVLAEALRRHAIENEVEEREETEFGVRYVVDGPLHAPDGSLLHVRSVWYTDRGGREPRFVTAHPLRRKP